MGPDGEPVEDLENYTDMRQRYGRYDKMDIYSFEYLHPIGTPNRHGVQSQKTPNPTLTVTLIKHKPSLTYL